MAVLRDLECGPMASGQRRDQASDYAGLADAAGMSADDDDCHITLYFAGEGARATQLLFSC